MKTIDDYIREAEAERQGNEPKSDNVELLALETLDVPQLLRQPTPAQEWTVRDRIPRRQVVLFSGEGAAGKSTLALQLAACHALNLSRGPEFLGPDEEPEPLLDWLFSLPEPGRALFIDAEDEVGVLHRRLDGIRAHYRVTDPDEFETLDVVSLAGQDAVLARADRGVVKPTVLYKRLERHVRTTRPILTVLASSANVFAGDELDRAQVQQFISLLTHLAILGNGAVMLLSHPSLTGISSATGISGSTQWHNAVRARMYLHAIKANGDEPADPDARVLEFKKNQYGPIAEAITLRWKEGLFLPEGAAGSLDKLAREARADEVFAYLVRHYYATRRSCAPLPSARNYAPRVFAIEPAALEHTLTKAELEKAMARLFAGNRIKIEDRGPPSRRFQYIIPA